MYSAGNEQINQTVNIDFSGDDKLTNIVTKITTEISNLQLKIFAANVSFGALGQTALKNNKTFETLTKTVTSFDKALQASITGQAVAKGLAQLGDGLSKARKELTNFNQGLRAMQSSGYSTQLLNDFQELGNVITFDTRALEQFSLQALTAYNRFAKAKSEVEVLFAPGDAFVKNLSANVQKLVNDDLKNAVTSIDALSASYQAASALFLEASENQAVMTAGLKLSKAGGADAGATMQVLTQTIRAYNLQASDANKVAAALNETIKLGITSLPELAQGFAQTAVVAKEAGVKLEELSGAVAALTLKGSSTPAALTGLEALSRVIINKTPQATAALRELRDEAGKPIKFDIAEIKAKGLAKALDDLNKAANGNASVLAEVIPESLAYSTALGLMADNAKQLTNNTKQIGAIISTGSAAKKALDEVFGIKLNNNAEKFEAIINRMTEQFIQFGEQLAPFFEVGINAVEQFSKMLSGISPEMKKLIAQVVIGQMAFGNTLNILKILASTVLNIAGTFVGWRVTMLLFNGQLGKTIDNISGLIKTKAGLIPVLKQIIGLDQSQLLLEKENLVVSKSKFKILNELRTGEVGRLQSLKELLGWDKEYIITTEKANASLAQKSKLLNHEIETNRTVVKAKKELQKIEKEVNTEKEKETKLFDKLLENQQKQLEIEEAIIANKKNIDTSRESGKGGDAYNSQKNIIELEKEKIKLNNKQLGLQKQLDDQTQKYGETLKKYTDEEIKVNEKRKQIGSELTKLNREKLKISDLEIESINLQNDANKYAEKAEKLRTLAKTDVKNASKLLDKAERAEAISKGFSNKVLETNNKLQEANLALKAKAKAAFFAEEVANGRLLEVQTKLGKGYIANNKLTRVLFADVSQLAKNAFASASSNIFSFGAIFTNVFNFVKGLSISTFTTIKALAVQALGSLAPFLAPLAPLLLALTPIVLVLHDQFAGTGKQIRDLNNSLEETSTTLNANLIKKIKESEVTSKLSSMEVKRLHDLEMQQLQLEKQEGIWESIFGLIEGGIGNITKAFGDIYKFFNSLGGQISDFFENLLLQIPVIGETLSAVLDTITSGLGKLWDNFNLDRVQGTLGKIQDNIEKTQKENLRLIESNKKVMAGLTGDPQVDKILKAGGSLSVQMQQRAKAAWERNKAQIEEQIKSNDTNLEKLNKQLEKYDSLTPEQQKEASSSDQALANKRTSLEASNEKLKKTLDKAGELNKAAESFRKDREQILKTIDENNLKIGAKSTTKQEDVGVNAVETRLKKSLRQSKEDLDKYTQFVIAGIDGSNKVIVDGVQRDLNIVEDLGENSKDKFAEKIQQNIADINQLYEYGTINAEEAAKQIDEILNKQRVGVTNAQFDIKNLLENSDYLDILKTQTEFFKKSSQDRISKMSDEANFWKEMQQSKVTTTDEANKQIRKLELQQLEEQIKINEKQLEVALSTGSQEQANKIVRQLNILKQQQTQLVTRNAIEEKNDLLNIEKEKNEGVLQLNQIYFSARIGDQEKLNKTIGDLELKQIQNTKQQLINQIEEYKKIPGVRVEELKKLEQQLSILTAQEAVKRIEITNREIDIRYKKQEDKLNKETAILRLQREQYKVDADTAIVQLENQQKKSIILKQKEIQERIALSKKNNVDTRELEKQLVDLQLSYQEVITKSLEREYQKRIKLLNLNTEKTSLNYQKILNTLDGTSKSLSEEQKIIESRNSLTRSQADYEEARLQLQLRITTDIEKRAELETKATELKQKNLEREQEIENNSFLVQQKIVDLGLQRQQIELNIKKLQNETSNKLLELELEKAVKEKISETDIKAIELKLAANKEEKKVLESNQNLLNITKENQKEITANNKKQLEYKQSIAKEGGLLDIELAKEQQIIAKYEKQIQLTQLESQKQQLLLDQKLKTFELLNKGEERRTNILNKQLEAEEQLQSTIQKQFGIAMDLTENEKKKAKLAEAAAAQELNALNKKQELEEKLLQMQLKQNRTALERAKIEQQVAKLRLEAELKIEKANAAKVMADKTKTTEEKEAAQAGVQAKEFALKAQQYEDLFLQQREADLAIDEELQKYNLQEKQRNETLDKTLSYVKATKSKRDDKALLRSATNAVSPFMGQTANVNPNLVFGGDPSSIINKYNNVAPIPSFNTFLGQEVPVQKPELKMQPINFNSALNNNNNTQTQQQTSEKQPIVINFTNTNDIKVTSDNPTKELAEKLQETTISTMYNVFRKVNTDLGNN